MCTRSAVSGVQRDVADTRTVGTDKRTLVPESHAGAAEAHTTIVEVQRAVAAIVPDIRRQIPGSQGGAGNQRCQSMSSTRNQMHAHCCRE